MYRIMMAAMGAMILCALAGCTMQREPTVSAMVRTEDGSAGPAVRIDLSEIVRP
jgi:hypothetical protein